MVIASWVLRFPLLTLGPPILVQLVVLRSIYYFVRGLWALSIRGDTLPLEALGGALIFAYADDCRATIVVLITSIDQVDLHLGALLWCFRNSMTLEKMALWSAGKACASG
jgi:hypothetical protein